ncbi:MAG: high-affinity iron transporter [Actinomycetota bacterium]|jgi:high-affinity iron transporter|nr:high-affinity iron transporter [Actinomycetota bacterium]
MLREGFEAALVVSIVFAYLRRIERLDLSRWAWLGVAAAVAVASLIAVVIHLTIGSLDGVARLRAFAIVSLAAAAVLTWMIFWMRRQSRAIKGDIEHHIDDALASGGSKVGRAVALVAFLAVLREGVEASLFLIAAATSAAGTQVLFGALAGTAIAAVLGVLVYLGGRRLPMKAFFTVTGIIIIVFAAGLLARTVLFLQAAGDLGTIHDNVYDLTGFAWLTQHTEVGKFLAAMFGWDPRPSTEQVIAWAAYLVPVTHLFLRGNSAPPPQRVASGHAAGADAQPLEPVGPVAAAPGGSPRVAGPTRT